MFFAITRPTASSQVGMPAEARPGRPLALLRFRFVEILLFRFGAAGVE